MVNIKRERWIVSKNIFISYCENMKLLYNTNEKENDLVWFWNICKTFVDIYHI